MKISDLSAWVEHLTNPLVLAGFIMMLFAAIAVTLLKTGVIHTTEPASVRLARLVVWSALVLGLIIVGFGFGYSVLNHIPKAAFEGSTIKQETSGEQSPNIVTGVIPGKHSIEQKSTGNQSHNVISGKEGPE